MPVCAAFIKSRNAVMPHTPPVTAQIIAGKENRRGFRATRMAAKIISVEDAETIFDNPSGERPLSVPNRIRNVIALKAIIIMEKYRTTTLASFYLKNRKIFYIFLSSSMLDLILATASIIFWISCRLARSA